MPHLLPICLSIWEHLARGVCVCLVPTYILDIASKAQRTQYQITEERVNNTPPHTHTHHATLNPAPAIPQWSDTPTTKLICGHLPGRSMILEWTWRPCVKYLSSTTLTVWVGGGSWLPQSPRSSPLVHRYPRGISCPHCPIDLWCWWTVHLDAQSRSPHLSFCDHWRCAFQDGHRELVHESGFTSGCQPVCESKQKPGHVGCRFLWHPSSFWRCLSKRHWFNWIHKQVWTAAVLAIVSGSVSLVDPRERKQQVSQPIRGQNHTHGAGLGRSGTPCLSQSEGRNRLLGRDLNIAVFL